MRVGWRAVRGVVRRGSRDGRGAIASRPSTAPGRHADAADRTRGSSAAAPCPAVAGSSESRLSYVALGWMRTVSMSVRDIGFRQGQCWRATAVPHRAVNHGQRGSPQSRCLANLGAHQIRHGLRILQEPHHQAYKAVILLSPGRGPSWQAPCDTRGRIAFLRALRTHATQLSGGGTRRANDSGP
jgi:hypothetical protein